MPQLAQASSLILARWILPISQPPIENGCLAIDGENILSIVTRQEYDSLPEKIRNERSHDFGESIVLPGLMNLHTHLDYTNLKHFDNYSPFFQWIRSLIANSWQWTGEQWLDSAFAGARESMLAGTSTIADASYSGAAARAVALTGLRGVVGLELFGIIEEEADEVFAAWLQKYQRFIDESGSEVKQAIDCGRLKLTIAPHTPYSVCPALIRKSLSWSREHHVPLLIHIAESEAECRWLAASDADLDKFLEEAFRRSLPALSWRGHGLSPVRHMEKHGLLDANVLAAHVVQVNDEDVKVLARHKVSAVHCPRSNSRLRNGVAPLSKLMNAGITLGLGTDSAASTDDLNVLSEARFAWDLHRAQDKTFSETAEKAIHYLTLGGAQALGMEKMVGSLDSGKKADFTVFSIAGLPEIARERPHECLIYGGAELKVLVVNGISLVVDGYIARNGCTV